MKRIELEIVADNSQYIQSAKQVEQATTSMHTKNKAAQKEEQKLIDSTVDAYDKMNKQKKQAFDGKEIGDYANKTKAAGDAVEKMGGAAGGAVGKVRSLSAAFKALLANPVAIAITAILAALSGLVKIFKSTDSGANALAARFEQLKAIFDVFRQRIIGIGSAIGNIFKGNWKQAGEDMKNSFRGIGDQIRDATSAAYDYIYAIDAIEDAENNFISRSAELRNEIARLEFTAQDRNRTFTERKKALQDALRLGEEEVKAQREFARKRLEEEIKYLASKNNLSEFEVLQFIKMTDAERAEADKTLQTFYNNNEAKIIDLEKFYAEWINLDTRFFEENKRNMSRLSGFIEQETKAMNEKRLADQKAFTEALIKLEDAYNASRIENLEGKDRINAERDYQLAQIAELKKHLESLGTLTEEHYQMLAALEDNVRTESLKKELDFEQEQIDAIIEHGNTIRDLERQLQEEALDLLEDNQEEKLKLQIKFAEEDIKTLQALGTLTSQAEIAILKQRIQIWNKEIEDNKKEIEDNKKDAFSIWRLFGIDPNSEEGQKMQENLQIMVDSIVSSLDSIFSARVEDTQRTRELLDDQIGMTQDALEAEMDLMKEGFANNVDAKRKELEALKKQREIAMREEEKALKAQQQLDTAMQVSSLVSAAANIFKGFSTLPIIGQVLAVAAVASMFAAFASAKVKAAAATKLAEGGAGTETGMITGRSHAQGGERFLDHVEVERGEMWGVLSKRATAKYGKQFGQIVTSFNKDQIPLQQMADVHNNILVDVSQTNERLDRVQGELIKLNRHFGVSAEVIETPTARIIKRGNKTRIIRK